VLGDNICQYKFSQDKAVLTASYSGLVQKPRSVQWVTVLGDNISQYKFSQDKAVLTASYSGLVQKPRSVQWVTVLGDNICQYKFSVQSSAHSLIVILSCTPTQNSAQAYVAHNTRSIVICMCSLSKQFNLHDLISMRAIAQACCLGNSLGSRNAQMQAHTHAHAHARMHWDAHSAP